MRGRGDDVGVVKRRRNFTRGDQTEMWAISASKMALDLSAMARMRG